MGFKYKFFKCPFYKRTLIKFTFYRLKSKVAKEYALR